MPTFMATPQVKRANHRGTEAQRKTHREGRRVKRKRPPSFISYFPLLCLLCVSVPLWLALSSDVVAFRGGAAGPVDDALAAPPPAADARHVVAVPVDVLLVLDQLVADGLLEVGGA